VLTPPLSVIEPPVAAMARKAWALLQARMEGGGGRRRHISLAATLVERASLAPPPAEPARRRGPRAVRAA